MSAKTRFRLNFHFLGLYLLYQIYPNVLSFFKNFVYKLLPFSYTDKFKGIEWVLVTGATDGVGFRMAQELAKAGKGVIFLGKNKERLLKVKDWFDNNKFTKYKMVELDMSKMHSINEYAAKWKAVFESLPPVDLLINNAALVEVSRMTDIKYQDAEMLLSTNSVSQLVVTNEYLKHLQTHNRTTSRIIFLSSGSLFIRYGYYGHYSYSKHICTSYFKFINSNLPQSNIASHMSIVYLGNTVTKMNYLDHNLYKKDEAEILKKKSTGAVTALQSARSILWQSYGEFESHGPAMHYIQHVSIQNPLVHEIGKYTAPKVLNMMADNKKGAAKVL